MSNNPFADAIKPDPKPAITRTVEPEPFFRQAAEAERLRHKARNMTRQDMFNNGMLTVKDMDDEELRAGRMRDNLGRIPKVTKTLENIPRDLYDAMVAEHQTRTQEKFREQLDEALNTLVGIMTDDTCEPKDRADAAKYLIERTMGKTPERVQVAVAKAPWEEMLGDFANTSRERHAKLEQGVIDAEVVEDVVPQVHPTGEVDSQGLGPEGVQGTEQRDGDWAVPEPSAEPQTGATDSGQVQRGQVGPGDGRPTHIPDDTKADGGQPHSAQGMGDAAFGVDADCGDPRIIRADEAPSYDKPASSNPTNSERIRAEQERMRDLAQRRTDAKKRIQDAKRKRAARRAMGVVGGHGLTVETTLVEDPEAPGTGKLRHTID